MSLVTRSVRTPWGGPAKKWMRREREKKKKKKKEIEVRS